MPEQAKDPLTPGARKIWDQTRSQPEEPVKDAEEPFSFLGRQVTIQRVYPEDGSPVQWAFSIDGERRGTAYLPEQAQQQARTYIRQVLGASDGS
jgi:hypothetical protein